MLLLITKAHYSTNSTKEEESTAHFGEKKRCLCSNKTSVCLARRNETDQHRFCFIKIVFSSAGYARPDNETFNAITLKLSIVSKQTLRF